MILTRPLSAMAPMVTMFSAVAAFAVQAPPLFRTDTDLVAVSVTVVDAEGRLVRGLDASAFTAFENERRRPIALFTSDPVPLSLVVALDTSASMQGPRFERARAVINRLLAVLSPQDELCLFGFNESPYRMVDWTNSRDTALNALGQTIPKGSTALYDAVTDALDALHGRTRRRQAVVVISDGNDHAPTSPEPSTTSGWEDSLRRQGIARARIQRSEAMLYAIGIDAPNTIGRDPLDANALRALTDRSGGFTEIVKSPDDLSRAADRIVEDLRHQYLIGFTPASLDGKFHRVKIVVNACTGCRVRARAGFVAARTPRS